MLNKIMIIGRLGQDPETSTGKTSNMCKFSVATSEKYKGEDQTEWHNVVAFGKLAEICSEYLNRGQLVYVDGKLTTNNWTDKKGFKHTDKQIIAHTMKMLDSPRRDRGSERPSQKQYSPPAPGDDEIPF